MLSEREFDNTVAGFYAAATGVIPWNEALAPLHTAFPARAAIVQSIDLGSGGIVQLSHAGDPMPEAFLSYLRYWHEVDPRRSHILAHAAETMDRWWHCSEQLDPVTVAKSPFFQDFLPAQRTRYLAASLHQPAPDTATLLALELPAERGPLDTDERHLAERLSRHFADALRTFERVRRLAAKALAGCTLLDAFVYPMWLVDADRVVLHANPAALAFIRDDERAAIDGRRLHWRTQRTDNRLRDALHGLGSDVRHGLRFVLDARARPSDPPSWLHLHALEPSRVLGGAFGERPVMLITLFDPERMTELDAFALSEIFGMTPAEGRVAALLGQGHTPKVIATHLGCQYSTVRTHLRNVLYKLGASRQAEAVRLLRQGEVLWSLPVRAGS